MIAPSTLRTTAPLKLKPGDAHAGLSGVFAAAVVSRNFREQLLKDPEQALKRGYQGKSFGLSNEDAALVVSISAGSLRDLAQQVVQTLA
jgi:hypothetical protein